LAMAQDWVGDRHAHQTRNRSAASALGQYSRVLHLVDHENEERSAEIVYLTTI
jgi:hypothetical protein